MTSSANYTHTDMAEHSGSALVDSGREVKVTRPLPRPITPPVDDSSMVDVHEQYDRS